MLPVAGQGSHIFVSLARRMVCKWTPTSNRVAPIQFMLFTVDNAARDCTSTDLELHCLHVVDYQCTYVTSNYQRLISEIYLTLSICMFFNWLFLYKIVYDIQGGARVHIVFWHLFFSCTLPQTIFVMWHIRTAYLQQCSSQMRLCGRALIWILSGQFSIQIRLCGWYVSIHWPHMSGGPFSRDASNGL